MKDFGNLFAEGSSPGDVIVNATELLAGDQAPDLAYWKRPRVLNDIDPVASEAWHRALHDARARDTDYAPIPILVGALAPWPAVPADLAGQDLLVADTLRILEPGAMAWTGAAEEIEELQRRQDRQELVLLIRISALVAMDPGFESFALTFEVLSRMQAASRRLVLLGTASEALRLSRRELPLDIIRLSPAPRPRSLRPVVCEPCLGRAREVSAVVSLVLQGSNVLVTGPAGVGKTVLARAIADHPDLEGREVLELDSSELLAGTEHRGALEARVNELVDWTRGRPAPPIVIFDELVGGGKAQRTGQQEGSEGSPNQDSLIDLLKGELSRSCPSMVVVGTVTDRERAALHRLDPAITRRFSEVRLRELKGAALDEVAAGWAERLGIGSRDRRRIVRLAPELLPEETAVAAVVKVMRWCEGHEGGVLEALRDRFGELAAPRRARLLEGIAGLEGRLWRRSRELAALERAVEAALERLVRGGDPGGPFLALLVSGPEGSGKRFFTWSVAEALGAGAIHQVEASREELRRFARTHASVPGGALILRGTAGHGGTGAVRDGALAEEGESAARGVVGSGFSVAEALHIASTLQRWLLCIVLRSDQAPEWVEPRMIPGDLPAVGLTLRPVVPDQAERLSLARQMAARMRENALDRGITDRLPRPDDAALKALSSEPLTPAALEGRVAGLILGRSPERTAKHGGAALPVCRLGILGGPGDVPQA